jgi:hypothetical protein
MIDDKNILGLLMFAVFIYLFSGVLFCIYYICDKKIKNAKVRNFLSRIYNRTIYCKGFVNLFIIINRKILKLYKRITNK